MQQRVQASGRVPGTTLQSQNAMQKQLYQSPRPLSETSSTSLIGHATGGDWQEEIYQNIKVMEEKYMPQLSEMYSKIAKQLQQHDSLPQQSKLDQLDKLKMFKTMLERFISVLRIPKHSIQPGFKDKLVSYEKQMVNVINTYRPRKQVPSIQQGQLPPTQMHSMQQSQPQITQVQSHENQMNPQMRSIYIQPSAMQQNNMASLKQNSMSSLSGVSTVQQNMTYSPQPGSNMDSRHGNSVNSLQQIAAGYIQQTPVSAPPQANMNTLSSQGGANMLLPNMTSLQSNSGMLQSHIKQQLYQQVIQNQQKQRQIQQHVSLQKKQMLQHQQQQLQKQAKQQLQQQAKQQLPGQLPANQHQMPQVHQNQINDVIELKLKQGMGAKPGVFQQPLSGRQRTYPHPQLKSGSAFPISSTNQHLQTACPQISQHSSPQVDQQSLLTHPKAGTPLQTSSSSFVIPSPPTPMAPSPMPGDSDKPSSLSNAGNIGHQQTTGVGSQPQSLAIGTPGISASPLLAEFSVPDGTHVNALSTNSGKSSAMEQPLQRLIKAVKSISPNALVASVSDIGSVVSMIDRIPGSAPGNVMTPNGVNGTRKMRRYTSAGSMNDSFKQLSSPETSDLELTATPRTKRPRIEANHALLEEIREINRCLIDTVVDISNEDVDRSAAGAEGSEGTTVRCSFNAVALSPNLKSQYASAQMSAIQPLRLLVPKNYPSCSPILLDKFPVEVSKEYQDLSVKAKSRFSISLRSISQPMSLEDIARTWDVCARAIISEHAQQSGGGSFSSKYGTWEDCLSPA